MQRGVPSDVRKAALATGKPSDASSGPSHKAHSSPSKFFKRVLHPHRNGDNASPDRGKAKRIRAGDAGDDVIVVDSDSEEPGPSHRPENIWDDIDYGNVLKVFRVPVAKLA